MTTEERDLSHSPTLTSEDLVQMLVRAELANDPETVKRISAALGALHGYSRPLVPVAPERSSTTQVIPHEITISNKVTELNAAYLNGIAVSVAGGGILGVALNTFLTRTSHSYFTAAVIGVAAVAGSGIFKSLANRQLLKLLPPP